MSMTFLDYYRENLAHVRMLASEFAAEFPKIAARLELSEFECQDPYVERLLEGSAFLAARVEKKLEDGFPRLLESILSAVAPAALFPTPSACVLELQPNFQDEQIKRGAVLKAGSLFRCPVSGTQTQCTYSTTSEVKLSPLAVVEAEYCTRELEHYRLDVSDAHAALSIKLKRTDGGLISQLDLDELSLFMNLTDSGASQMLGQLLADLEGVYCGTGADYRKCPTVEVHFPMFTDKIDVLSTRFRQLAGLQVMQQFLAYPAAFKFFRLSGLREVFRHAEGASLELVFMFTRRENDFIHGLGGDNFKLWCVPAVNLFKKNSDRAAVNGQYEFHVVPERTAPLDFEVFKIALIETYNERNESLFECFEFYDESGSGGRNHVDFFSLHRRNRLVNNTRTARSSYPGSEAFVSFSGKNWTKRWEEVRQFRAEMWCTNRDLPLLTRFDAVLTASAGELVSSAVFAVAPSRPLPALIQNGGAEDWKKIGHIGFNLSSALWRPGEVPAELVRNLINSYSVRSEDETRRLLDGITSIRTEPMMFRFVHQGCVFFENGWRIHLTLSEQQYAGVGYFVFALVLRELLESYTPLNSCAELVVHTDKRMNVVKWKLQEK